MEEIKRPRYYKEANSPFLLPGGYSLSGLPFGLALIVVGMGLRYWWLVPVGIGLTFYLMKKGGEDEHFLRSMLSHLLTYKGVRYFGASPKPPSARVKVIDRSGRTLPVSEWLELRKERVG